MKWYLYRRLEFYPFHHFLVSEGYVRGKNKVFKWRFKNLFFYFKNGLAYSFRGLKDLENLKAFFGSNLNKPFIKRIGREIRKSADILFQVTKRAFRSKTDLQKKFKEFCNAYKNMFCVFQTPELAEILTPAKGKRTLYRFGLDRDYAARVFAKVEKLSAMGLAKILELPEKSALMLLPGEIERYLADSTLPPNFRKRKSYASLTSNGKTRIYWNKKADQVFFREYLRFVESQKKENRLEGRVAFKGFARGKAFVAWKESDFKKMPTKTILICTMTRYTVVPYLKRAAAIVTDEGGITSHAAIISRELKIPTIIGTQLATNIFKTGDSVEVDANKGIVRKIK